jgi:hypothetical protein
MTSGKQKGKAVPSSGSLNVYLQDAVMQVETENGSLGFRLGW